MEQFNEKKIIQDFHSTSYSPTICVTHQCNLSCVYCYQKNKDYSKMNISTAKKCVDDIFDHIPPKTKIIEITFIGGEPLLETSLLKEIYNYTSDKYHDKRLSFYATTNGTTLTSEDKRWFFEHRNRFILGLSLDGTSDTHNHNRSNSYEMIDIPFFVNTWPDQGPKMTISKYSIKNLAKDIISIFDQGFTNINGVNFAEGDFEWESDESLMELSKQLKILLDYYTINYNSNLDQLLGKHIEFCSSDNVERYKPCGIGTRTLFYDVDGEKYPCSFVTPLTFSKADLETINGIDFSDNSNFVDIKCADECYLYPICTSCSGANYLVNHTFNKRIKSRCRMNKLVSLYIAELHTRRIISHRELYKDNDQLYFLIKAIKGIKENYYNEFKKYLIF